MDGASVAFHRLGSHSVGQGPGAAAHHVEFLAARVGQRAAPGAVVGATIKCHDQRSL